MSSQVSASTMTIPPDSYAAAGGPTTQMYAPRSPDAPDEPPRTFWRRHLVVHWRRRCLARQVPRSLQALAAALQPVTA